MSWHSFNVAVDKFDRRKKGRRRNANWGQESHTYAHDEDFRCFKHSACDYGGMNDKYERGQRMRGKREIFTLRLTRTPVCHDAMDGWLDSSRPRDVAFWPLAPPNKCHSPSARPQRRYRIIHTDGA